MAVVDINTNSQRIANPNYNYPSGPDLNRFAVPAANNYFNTPNATAALVCAPRLLYRQYVAWGNPASTYYSISTSTPGTAFSTSKTGYCTSTNMYDDIEVKDYTPKPGWSPFGNFKDPSTQTDNTNGSDGGTVQLVQRIHGRIFDLPTPGYALEMDSLGIALESVGQPVSFHNNNSGVLYTAYTIMHDALSRGIYDHVIPVTDSTMDSVVVRVLEIQDSIWVKAQDRACFWSKLKFELIRDWAQVYRLAEHRSLAVSNIEDADLYITNEADLGMLGRWQCVNEAELAYLDDTLSYDSLMAFYPCVGFAEPEELVLEPAHVYDAYAVNYCSPVENVIYWEPCSYYDAADHYEVVSTNGGNHISYNSETGGCSPWAFSKDSTYEIDYYDSNHVLIKKLDLALVEKNVYDSAFISAPDEQVACSTEVDLSLYTFATSFTCTDSEHDMYSRWVDAYGADVTYMPQTIYGPTLFYYECYDLTDCSRKTTLVVFNCGEGSMVSANKIYKIDPLSNARSLVTDASLMKRTTPDKKQGEVVTYPNPANNILNIELKGLEDEAIQSITMIDMQGRTVLRSNSKTPKVALDISALSSGTYKVAITTDKQYIVKTINVIH